ncbi:MAG: DUF4293 domain-containing protein [Chlorobi bacterium]|nr:DUF4293 domain-containing protein [Chlorobiota bacterium]
MIQRIQTVYILISIFLMGLGLTLPLAEISANGELFLFKAAGILKEGEVVFSGLPLQLFIGIIILIHIIAVFSHKKRIRQMRLLVFAIILMLGLFGLFYYFAYASFENQAIAFKIATVFPFVAIILDYLAIRNIGKDEALVRSLDRIR